MLQKMAIITALITERPLCISCIAAKAGESSAEALEAVLDQIHKVLVLHRTRARCDWCGMTAIVFSAERTRPEEHPRAG